MSVSSYTLEGDRFSLTRILEEAGVNSLCWNNGTWKGQRETKIKVWKNLHDKVNDVISIWFIPSLTYISTIDLKDLSPAVSMSVVLIFGISKASSFSLSKFILELSLRVSESAALWFWSFTRLENILQVTKASQTNRYSRKERRTRGQENAESAFFTEIFTILACGVSSLSFLFR